MENTNFEEFQAECEALIARYVGKCHKNFLKNKDYKSLAKSLIASWFKIFAPSMANIEVLRVFTISLKENKKEYAKCNDEDKYIINLMIDMLGCITELNNTIMEITSKILSKL